MEKGRSRILTAPPSPRGSLWRTTVLVLLGVVVMGALGFSLGVHVLARKLKPSEVHRSHPEPVRVLSPSEAQAQARNEASPVWTRGVQDSDIPKVTPEDDPARKPRTRRRTPELLKPSAPATAVPTPTAPVPAVEAPPVEAPAPAETDTTTITPD